MALKKVSDSEVVSEDGYRVVLGRNYVTYVKGSRYITIPIDATGRGGGPRLYLAQMSPWMENGEACNTEETLNLPLMHSRVAAALALMGKDPTFDV